MGDDFRGVTDFGNGFTRMPIEDHYDFPPDEGYIVVPSRDIPEKWASEAEAAALKSLDRDFIFPGEQVHILVHVSSEDSGPEIVTPFKVAAAMNKLAAKRAKEASVEETKAEKDKKGSEVDTSKESSEASASAQEGGDGKSEQSPEQAVESTSDEVKVESQAENLGSPVDGGFEPSASPTTLLQQEEKVKRSQAILDGFRKSHYYVRVMENGEPLWQKRTVGAGGRSEAESRAEDELTKLDDHGCIPVHVELGKFDPQAAGGLARHADACARLDNGDIVVLLQLTMAATCITDDAVLEVLQFERSESVGLGEDQNHGEEQEPSKGAGDPTRGLLRWLLPLDRPSSPPPAYVGSIHNSPPKIASTLSNSNIFSFGPLRTTSSGSLPATQAQPVPPAAPSAPALYGPKMWDSVLQERNTKSDVGSEGLLSFRGVVLEPQRFSAHYGLAGPHVPGKRWRRKLSVVQPIKVESYFAHCNAQDLICVLVENILPPVGKTAGIVVCVDSINVVCHSTSPGSPPVPVPVSLVEVGDDYQLPGLPLRVGEQHSFVLKPTSPALKSSSQGGGTKSARSGLGPGLDLPNTDGSTASRKKISKVSPATEQYAVIISCRCSHTESLLHYMHSIQWRPRPPRDLLVSVSLEKPSASDSNNEIQAVFKSQVVTVQATNLTSKDMNLTLLAPSTLANSPLSMVSFPAPLADSPIPGFSQQHSFTYNEDNTSASASASGQTSELTSPATQLPLLHRSSEISLPPVQSIESVIGVSPKLVREKNVSAADIAAENSATRSHLWLQSTIPLGCVPARSTTAVKCDILPLTDGIITLDTLHISTNENDALYIPESPLQIYTTSSLATGVA